MVKNNTNQIIQLCVWCDDDRLYGELRSEGEFPWRYNLVEANHRFEKESEKYYRVSKIYKETVDRRYLRKETCFGQSFQKLCMTTH